MISVPELRKKWIRWVKQLTGVEEYHVSRSFNRAFAAGAQILANNPAIDPDQFCRAQIEWAIRRNRQIYPTLLSGNSVARYCEGPSESDRIKDLYRSFVFEIRDFSTLVRVHGFDHAVDQTIPEYSAVFLGLMYLDYRNHIPEDILLAARSQLRSQPEYKNILPAAYISRLEE